MEKRKRVEELERQDEMHVPQPNNSEKNCAVPKTSNPLFEEIYSKLDDAMKGFPKIVNEYEIGLNDSINH